MTSHAKVTISGYKAEQLDVLQQIRARAFAPVFRSLREVVGPGVAEHVFGNAEREQGKLLAELCGTSSSAKMLVALAEGRPVGFAAVTLNEQTQVGEIGLNAVDPDWVGRGIGTKLYRAALEKMAEGGMRVASVATGADPGHAPARRAYAKAGFVVSLNAHWLYLEL